jgi:hypothetical protein
MSKSSEHRANAEAAVKLAAKSDDGAYKAIMLQMAQRWFELSLRAEKSDLRERARSWQDRPFEARRKAAEGRPSTAHTLEWRNN